MKLRNKNTSQTFAVGRCFPLRKLVLGTSPARVVLRVFSVVTMDGEMVE